MQTSNITKNSKYSKDLVCKEVLNAWNKIKLKPKNEIENTIGYLIKDAVFTIQYLNPIQYFNTVISTQNKITEKIIVPDAPSPNVAAQKKVKETIIKTNKEIAKYQEEYNLTTDPESKYELMDRIQNLKQVLNNKDIKLQSLKKNADYYRSFRTIQSINKPVIVPDHDFSVSSQQKLVPLVYLIIDSNNTNDTLHSSQLSIYIQPQYELGTSSITYINNLNLLVNSGYFDNMVKVDNKIRPIWVLLIDKGPDENLHYLKNIPNYCNMFHSFNLDYLTVRTHAPDYSVYNSVERSIATLSRKLVGMVLPINQYGTHLDLQSNVIDTELEKKNFEYVSNLLCN
ncbi:14973_t:CDS:2 [Cetraspora pellucida]|uniref:14973_t:CDS:1 n=1 Tax=Cetraspora pellucida TaxID=1433469 RepID=A0A9N9NG64_9GLOM|nr:14973_t:CDS:2 [Cetraspora pellucida]